MGTVQGHVFLTAVRAKQTKVHTLPINGPLSKYTVSRSLFWGLKGISCGRTNVGNRLQLHNFSVVKCSFSSSSDGNGSMAENFSDNESEYVHCSVTEAVEVKSGPNGFMIKMGDDWYLRCALNNPQSGKLPHYEPHPAIVLKMEDGTGLLLPIIVLETQSELLMAALQNVRIARPTMYDVLMAMIDKTGYRVRFVGVTKRVHEAYYALLHLTKVEDATESITFDMRPSDAINIAVRCKVPILVRRKLVDSDGMRIIKSVKISLPDSSSDGFISTELNWRPSGEPCPATTEFDLLRNMLTAAIEERYKDAAQWRDKLIQFRSKKDQA